MSETIDERIVQLKIENNQFESEANKTMGTLNKLSSSFSEFGKNGENVAKQLDSVQSSISKSVDKFSAGVDKMDVSKKMGSIKGSLVSGASDIKNSFEKLEKSFDRINVFKKLDNISTNAFSNLKQDVKQAEVSMQQFGNSVEATANHFSTLRIIGVDTMVRLARHAEDMAVNLAKSLSIDQVKAGLNEYESKLDTIQVILANTQGANSLEEVKDRLEELNRYADKTIYNFGQMTQNIGRFTAAGVGLDDSVTAIKGLSNLSALVGANAEQNSRAMYNLSQALSVGKMQLLDWRSFENAGGLGGKVFRDELIKTADALGYFNKEWSSGSGMSSTSLSGEELKNQAMGIGGAFRETLKYGWVDNEVMIQTLQRFSDETTELGQRAYEAATQVRTFSKLMDTLKESVQSGWAESMEHIFGDYEEAPKVWTKLNEVIGGYLEKQAQARNADLEAWSQNGGRDNVIKGIANSYEILTTALDKLRSAFDNVFDTSRLDLLNRFSEGFANATGNLLALFKGANVINDPLEQLNNAISSLEKTNYGSSFIQRGIDVKQHVIDQFSTNGGYNNGNLKNILERDAIKWTDTLKEANKAALDSWGKNPLTGSYSITDLQAMTLDTIEGQLTVSVSPMLQTENGSEYLDRQTVTDYVNSIIDKAFSDAGSLSWEERTDQLFKLDKLGTVINDKEIKGLFGFVDIFSGSDEDAKKYIKQIDAISDAYTAFKEIVRTGDTTIDIAYSTPVEVPKDDKSTARKAIKEIKQQQKETSKLAKTMERLGDSVSGIDTKPLENTTEIFGELVKNKNLSQKDIRGAMSLVTDTVSERSSGLTRQQIALMDKQLEALRSGKDSGSVAAEIIKQNHDVTNSIRNLTEEEKHLKVPEALFDNSVEGRLSRAKNFSSKFGIVFEDIMSMVKEVLGMFGQIRRTAKTVFSAVFGGIDDGIAWMEISYALHGFLNTVHQVVDYIENYVAQGDTYNKLREMAAGVASFFSMMAKIKILKWKIIFRGIQFLVENLLPPLVDFLHVIGRGLNEVNGALGRFDITGKIYDLFDMILNSKGASLVIDGIKAIFSLLSQIASLTFTGVTNLIDSLNNFSMPNIGKGFKNFFGGIWDSFSDFSAKKEKLVNGIADVGSGIGEVILRSLDNVFSTEVAAAELGEEAEKTDEAIDKAVGGIKKTVTSIPGRIESSFGLAEGTLAEKSDSFADAIHGIPKKVKRALGKDTSESDNYILGLTPDGITAAFDSITGAMLTPAELEARINDAYGGVKDYVLREKDGIVAAFDVVSGEMLTAEEYAKRAHKGLDGLMASIKEYITAIPTNIKNKALDVTSSIGWILYGNDIEGAEKTNLMLERVSHAFDKVREAYQKVKTFLFGNSDEGKLGIFAKAWTKAFEFFTNEKIQNGVKGFFGFIRDKLSIAYNTVTGFFKAGENGEASRFSQTIGKAWEKLKEFFAGDAFREHIESTKNLFKALGKALLDFFSSGTFNKIANGFLIVGNVIKNLAIWILTNDAIRGFFGTIVGGISTLYHSAKESEAFKNVMQSLGHIIVSLAGAIGKLATSEGFKSFLSVAGKLLGGLIMTVDKIISSDVFKSAAGLIGDFFSSIFIGIDKLMSSDGLAQAGKAISDFFGSTGKTLEGLSTGEVKPDFSFLTGEDGTFGIIPMIRNAFNSVADYLASIDFVAIWKGFTGIVSSIWNGFLDAFRGHEVGVATMDDAVGESVEDLADTPKKSMVLFGEHLGDLGNAIAESLGNAGREVFGAIKGFFKDVGDQLSDGESALWGVIKGLGAITTIRLGNSLSGFYSSFKGVNKELSRILKQGFDKDLFNKIKKEKWFSLEVLTKPFSKGLNKFFERLPKYMAKGMTNLLKPLKVFSKGFNKFFGKLGKGVESFLTNFGKGMKRALTGFAWAKAGEGIKSFAIAIAILVFSIGGLISLPQEGIQNAINIIRDLGVMLVIFSGIMAFIAKKSGIFTESFAKGGIFGGFINELFGRDDPAVKLLKVGIGLLAMGAAIALVAKAASSVDKLQNPLISIGAVVLLIETVAESMAMLGNKTGLFAAGLGMTIMANAIIKLMIPIKMLHGILMNSGILGTMGLIVTYFAVIGEMFALTKSMSYLGNMSGLFSAGLGLTLLANALVKLTIPVYALGKMKFLDMLQGLFAVYSFLAVIGNMGLIINDYNMKGLFKKIASLSAGLALLSTAMTLMMVPLGTMALFKKDKLAQSVRTFLGVIATIAIAASYLGKFKALDILKNLTALAAGMALLGLAFVPLVQVFRDIGSEFEKIGGGLLVFSGLTLVITILSKIITPVILGKMFMFAIALGAVAAAVHLLAEALSYLMNGKSGGFGAVEVSAAEMTSDVGKTVPKNLNVAKPVAKSGKKTAQAYTKPMNQIPKVTKTIGKDSAEALNEGFEDGLDSLDVTVNDYVEDLGNIDGGTGSDLYSSFGEYAGYGTLGLQDTFDSFMPDMTGFTDNISGALTGSMDGISDELSNYSGSILSGGEGTDIVSNILGGAGMDTIGGDLVNNILGDLGEDVEVERTVTVTTTVVPEIILSTEAQQYKDQIQPLAEEQKGGKIFDEEGNVKGVIISGIDMEMFYNGIIPSDLSEIDPEHWPRMFTYSPEGVLVEIDPNTLQVVTQGSRQVTFDIDPETGEKINETWDLSPDPLTEALNNAGRSGGDALVDGIAEGINDSDNKPLGVGGMLASVLGLQSESELYDGMGQVAGQMGLRMIRSFESSITDMGYGIVTGIVRELFGEQEWFKYIDESSDLFKEHGWFGAFAHVFEEQKKVKQELNQALVNQMTADPGSLKPEEVAQQLGITDTFTAEKYSAYAMAVEQAEEKRQKELEEARRNWEARQEEINDLHDHPETAYEGESWAEEYSKKQEKALEEVEKNQEEEQRLYEEGLDAQREYEEQMHDSYMEANEYERRYNEELAETADESAEEISVAFGKIGDALTGVHEVGAAELDENPFEGVIVAMDESAKGIQTASESLDESFFGSDGLAKTVEKAFKFLSSVGGVFGSLFNAGEITDSWLNPVEPVEVQFHEISPQEQKASEAISNSYPKNPATIGQEDGNAYLDGVEQTVTERGPETGTIVRSIFDTDAAEKGSSSAESFTIGAKAKLSESSDVLGTTVFSIFDNEENTSKIQNAGAALADNLTVGYEAKSAENSEATGQAAVDNLVSGIGGADKTALNSAVKDLMTETAAGATTGESETALTNAGEQSSEKITNAFEGKYPQQAPEAGKGFTQSLAGGVTEEATTGASLPNAAQNVNNSLVDNTMTKLNQDAPKVGEFAVAGIANGTATPNAKQMLIDAGFGIGGGLLDAVNEKLKNGSPSKEFAIVGGFAVAGLVNKIIEELPTVAAAGIAMGDTLLSSYQSTAAQVDYVLNNDIQPTITPVLDLTRIQNGANYVNSMFQGRNAIDVVSDANLNFDRAFMANKQLQIDAAKGVDVINYREDFKALNDKLSDLGEAMSNMQWVTDTGAVIGAFQSPMNKALGFSSMKANRGL